MVIKRPPHFYCPECFQLVDTLGIQSYYKLSYKKLPELCYYDFKCKESMNRKGLWVDKNYNLMCNYEYYYHKYIFDPKISKLFESLNINVSFENLYTLIYTFKDKKSKNIGFAVKNDENFLIYTFPDLLPRGIKK